MAVKDFDRVADIYDATRAIPPPEMALLTKAMLSNIPGRGPVIDVGVGTGRFAAPLVKMGIDVVGIDVSKGMMARARAKGLRGLVYADVRAIPFRDEAFETALLVHVLHLVGDWPVVVRESARVARSTVMTVLESRIGTNLREEYRELRTRLGPPLVRFERGESGLQRLVPPLSTTLVAETQVVTDADYEIRHLSERGQSFTWDVPEDVHRRIIETLRSEHAGKAYRTKDRIQLVVWSAKELLRANLHA